MWFNRPSFMRLTPKTTVAPAKAGAYHVGRLAQRDAMDPSLRWGDGIDLIAIHNGILSCFFQGFSRLLFRNLRKPKAIRLRVECG